MELEIQLGKKTITLNSTLTVEQYQAIQLNRLFLDNKNSSKLLALYLGVDEKEIRNAKKEQVEFIEKIVFQKLTENINKEIIYTFDMDGITYGFENDWKKLAWGAWQDLEFLCADDTTKNIHKLLAVLYRPVIDMKGVKYKIEPYDSETIEERAELFKKVPIRIWFGAAQVFFLHRQRIHKQYKEYFGITDEDVSSDGEGNESVSKMAPQEATARFYFAATLELCNNDITKIRLIDKLPIYLCLNTLARNKDIREAEKREIQKMKNKYGTIPNLPQGFR